VLSGGVKMIPIVQGPSELGASGKLENWDRSKDLSRIAMPTLVIGARYDDVDAGRFP
jgi:proline iminopeptidase